MKLSVVILAAGQGTRMRSALPKVLHPLGGQPLLAHVLQAARALEPAQIIVIYGHGGERVREALAAPDLSWVLQAEQLGTGHAVAQALPEIPAEHRVLVLYGDVPLIRPQTLDDLLVPAAEGIGLLTARLQDPAGYGRILRGEQGNVLGIVEEKDATPEQKKVREVNTGLLAAPAAGLKRWLSALRNDNAQGEYYLTDIIAMAVAEATPVTAVTAADLSEVLGVNDRVQLAELERALQRRQAQALLREGLSLADADRFDLRGRLSFGQDCFIDVNVVLLGEVELGNDVHIGPNCVIRNCRIGDGAVIEANSVLDGARLGAGASVGPFARLRPGTELLARAKVGNFVEVKQAVLREGAKVNHLSYIGDADVGRGANVGAGTITCNYDGASKHKTVIGAEAFIGSGTNLVAPLEIGPGATIGAGSTISRGAPAGELTVARARQTTIPGWSRPRKGSED